MIHAYCANRNSNMVPSSEVRTDYFLSVLAEQENTIPSAVQQGNSLYFPISPKRREVYKANSKAEH